MSARFDDPGAAARSTPLREQLLCLLRDLRASLAARVEVAQVELRAGAHEIVGGAVALVSAMLFAIGAWVTACALLVLALGQAGLSWLAALLLVMLFNALLTVFALTRARRHLRHISLSHTYRTFLGMPQRVSGLPTAARMAGAVPNSDSHLQGIQHGRS